MILSPPLRISYDLRDGNINSPPLLLIDKIRADWRDNQVTGARTQASCSDKRLAATSQVGRDGGNVGSIKKSN